MEHALAKTTLFSGFLSTMLLTFLSFSLFLMQQTPRAIVVKCDGSVYDVDVDVIHRAPVPVWCDSLPSFGIKATFLFV